MPENHQCPSCGSSDLSVFYELEDVPVNSVLLLRTRQEALGYPKGDIRLAFCRSCGFITNVAFDPDLMDYTTGYEATQSYSPTFNTFAHRLAARLVDQYNLHGKDVIEIGCGQGEFLTLLCELGAGRGVGFDPAYIGGRGESEAAERTEFIADYYSEKYADYRGDFVCCKMTLEHIPDVGDFVGMARRSLGDRSDTIVFFQVPDVTRVLREVAFWDIYYEHCSYFSTGSLASLFRRCGFDLIHLAREYDDQYLMVECRPGEGRPLGDPEIEDDLQSLEQDVADFGRAHHERLATWRQDLLELAQKGHRVVAWGGSSKAVAFLTTLRIGDEISYVVDINPYKHMTYIAGTGQEIVAPDFLTQYRPTVVVVMNGIYREEIWADLKGMGLAPEIMVV